MTEADEGGREVEVEYKQYNTPEAVKKKGFKGQCVVCGKYLAIERPHCFDHLDIRQKFRLKTKSKQDEKVLEPVEGEDYWVSKEYCIEYMGSGSAYAWDDAHEDLSPDTSEIDWDVEEVERRPTGRTRLMSWDGQPFDVAKWRKEKMSALAVVKFGTNVRRLKQKFLSDY